MGYTGRSEGGLIELISANLTEEPDFLILPATPVTQGNEFMLEQKRDLETAMGISEQAANASNELFRKLYASILNMEANAEERKSRIHKEIKVLTNNALPESQSRKLAAIKHLIS